MANNPLENMLAVVDDVQHSIPDQKYIDIMACLSRLYKTQHFTPEQCVLMSRKGVYPYEYMDTIDRFKETALPPIEKFYSSLTNKGITQEDYKYAQEVWKAMGIMDTIDRFKETALPPIEKFYSSLTNKGITQEDYKYAQEVWKAMGIRNMGEWHDCRGVQNSF